jgi:hypothetical protein
LNASRALLNKEYKRLPAAEKDDNSYLLSRIGEHIIIVIFPRSGTYRTSTTTQTATNMVRTFYNIRFGLIVNIGGGAPKRPNPKNPLKDIRLRDVVVSIPKGSHGKHPINLFLPIFGSTLLFNIRNFGLILIILKVIFFIII